MPLRHTAIWQRNTVASSKEVGAAVGSSPSGFSTDRRNLIKCYAPGTQNTSIGSFYHLREAREGLYSSDVSQAVAEAAAESISQSASEPRISAIAIRVGRS